MRSRVTAVLLVIIGICTTAFLGGCGSDISQPPKDRSVSITDDRGQVIKLAKPAMRIISLEKVHTQKLFDIGLNAEIIGVSHEEAADAFASGNPAYGYQDDPQRVIAAQPQLVLATPARAAQAQAFIVAVEAAGIPVACLDPQGPEYSTKMKALAGIKP